MDKRKLEVDPRDGIINALTFLHYAEVAMEEAGFVPHKRSDVVNADAIITVFRKPGETKGAEVALTALDLLAATDFVKLARERAAEAIEEYNARWRR